MKSIETNFFELARDNTLSSRDLLREYEHTCLLYAQLTEQNFFAQTGVQKFFERKHTEILLKESETWLLLNMLLQVQFSIFKNLD